MNKHGLPDATGRAAGTALCGMFLAIAAVSCTAAPPPGPPLVAHDTIIQFVALETGAPVSPQPDILFRNPHRFHINAAPDERIGVSLSGVRSAAPPARLVGPDGKTVASAGGGAQSTLDLPVEREATYGLLVSPEMLKMFHVNITNRDAVVELPLHVMAPRGNAFRFFVPLDTKAFQVYARGGGGKENVGVDILGPDGSPAATGDGDPATCALTLSVDVPAHQMGAIWTAVVRPPKVGTYDDVYLDFSENIPPYVAFGSHRLMREKVYGAAEIRRLHAETLQRLRERIEQVNAASEPARFWRGELLSRLARLTREPDGGLKFTRLQHWKARLAALDILTRALKAGHLRSRRYVPYAVRPITNTRILPDSPMDTGVVSDTLHVVAARGEYEPASFVLSAREDIRRVRLRVSALAAANGATLAPEAVDIRVVKCWYQDTGSGDLELTPSESMLAIKRSGRRALMPELLLKDAALIRTEAEGKRNLIRSADGGYREAPTARGQGPFPTDSDTLLPVDIGPNTNRQFWITVHVPEDAAPGEYEGAITLRDDAGTLGEMALRLTVLPFNLEAPYYISSLYYYPPHRGLYGEEGMWEQYRKELENLYAHGLTDVMMPYHISHTNAYEIRRAVGMTNATVFYRGFWPGAPTEPAALEKIREEVARTMAFFETFGVNDVYIYGVDEAKGPQLTRQRPAWEAIHAAGGKVFASGYVGSNFEAVGDIQDMLVCAGYPDPQEAAKWHGRGHKIVCYANPQGGLEKPETYRKNYGLLLWQKDYDGAMNYLYHWGREGLRTWDDPRSGFFKQHNMVYPASNGVVDTLQWEGYREGVDDVRYLSTLLKAIESARGSADARVRAAVREAEAYLAELKAGDVNVDHADMDLVRARIVGHIMSIRQP